MTGQAGQGSQDNKARPGQRRMAQWTRDYARLPGIPDEYIGQDGVPRAAWTRFFDAFAALAPADIERRFASADRHLREAGVTYRAPGDTADRLWPLSHLPLIIDETDWQQLTTGIAQRAQLFEMVLRDLYGEGRLVAEGAVPAAAIAGSNEYLRAVSGDRIHIRTVAGLKRLDVLLRRVDSNYLDPLELDASSHLGVPGLIDVLRKGGVVVANMPGSGVLEARALLGFLPSLSRRLLGEQLEMPHIATWWCGQKSAREEVLSRLDDFAIEGAYSGGVPGFPGNGPVLAGELSPAERERLRNAISDRGIDYVGQELVRLSTTPVWENGRIAPRPFVLRVFAAATPQGWTILPGGFCRIAEQADARAVSMGDGARAADVWVVSDKAVSSATLLPAAETVRIRRIAGVVPSRAADNLFWLGRYLERAGG